ncbi:MAG TPA: sugar phosphate isomerase/epimerase [Clostridiales bacterium]|nr:sugar phosphate isomerase/epimerase [Clostridiales bacterium]
MLIMKIGVSSYSFSKLVRSGVMSQLDIIAKVKEMGFDVIEFSTLTLPEGETPLSFAPKVKEECDRVGIEIANYTIAGDFLNGCNGDLDAEIERLKGEVDIAQILGSPGMRHDAAWGFAEGYKGVPSFDAALPRMSKGCRAVSEYAAEKGIKTMVENHGQFAQDSDRVERLVTAVDHPNFGLLVDMGNFLCVDEAPEHAVGRLMPYAFHVHAKDFHVKSGNEPDPGSGWFTSRGGNYLRGSIIGHGVVPIVQCLKIMKNKAYNGVLSIEFEGMEEPLKGIEVGLENLRRYVAQVY